MNGLDSCGKWNTPEKTRKITPPWKRRNIYKLPIFAVFGGVGGKYSIWASGNGAFCFGRVFGGFLTHRRGSNNKKTHRKNEKPVKITSNKIAWWIKGSFWTYLVGGWTNPFEKILVKSNWIIPPGRAENKKPPPSCRMLQCIITY